MMGEEAEWLDMQSDYGAGDHIRERDDQFYFDEIEDKKKQYKDNKQSQIGTPIRCANCSKRILKKSYQTQFCSNKGQGNCKDAYWNNVSAKRRARGYRL